IPKKRNKQSNHNYTKRIMKFKIFQEAYKVGRQIMEELPEDYEYKINKFIESLDGNYEKMDGYKQLSSSLIPTIFDENKELGEYEKNYFKEVRKHIRTKRDIISESEAIKIGRLSPEQIEKYKTKPKKPSKKDVDENQDESYIKKIWGIIKRNFKTNNMEKELNEEYISLISQMIELNKKRVDVYKKFRTLKPDVNTELKEMRTVSLYHDLYGNDLDKIKNK
ncbi:MAG TPA: hypothetical protein VLB82_02875, partial [Thermodesulfobacteriota bacterium]|nr:hypothetical protein [Thermodesulfobacteriota bacterium]